MLISSSKNAFIRLGVGDEREGAKTDEGRPRDAATGARTWRVICEIPAGGKEPDSDSSSSSATEGTRREGEGRGAG